MYMYLYSRMAHTVILCSKKFCYFAFAFISFIVLFFSFYHFSFFSPDRQLYRTPNRFLFTTNILPQIYIIFTLYKCLKLEWNKYYSFFDSYTSILFFFGWCWLYVVASAFCFCSSFHLFRFFNQSIEHFTRNHLWMVHTTCLKRFSFCRQFAFQFNTKRMWTCTHTHTYTQQRWWWAYKYTVLILMYMYSNSTIVVVAFGWNFFSAIQLKMSFCWHSSE